jgi:hypothetical protein
MRFARGPDQTATDTVAKVKAHLAKQSGLSGAGKKHRPLKRSLGKIGLVRLTQ